MVSIWGRWSQWSCSLMFGSAVALLLGFWVRIPPGARTSVCCECCVLWGRGLCDWLITRPEESYRLCCVCHRDVSIIRRPCPNGGCYSRGGGNIRIWEEVVVAYFDIARRSCEILLTGYGTLGGAAGWGITLQAGRSRVWFPMVSLEFFVDIILLATIWLWSRLSL